MRRLQCGKNNNNNHHHSTHRKNVLPNARDTFGWFCLFKTPIEYTVVYVCVWALVLIICRKSKEVEQNVLNGNTNWYCLFYHSNVIFSSSDFYFPFSLSHSLSRFFLIVYSIFFSHFSLFICCVFALARRSYDLKFPWASIVDENQFIFRTIVISSLLVHPHPIPFPLASTLPCDMPKYHPSGSKRERPLIGLGNTGRTQLVRISPKHYKYAFVPHVLINCMYAIIHWRNALPLN